MPSYPSGMTVSNRALIMLADALRQNRAERKTRWRRLEPGRQALLVISPTCARVRSTPIWLSASGSAPRL